MVEEKEIEIVYAGSHCDEKERTCKVWWVSTIKGKTISAEVEIPHYALISTVPQHAELKLDEIFRDTTLKLSNVKIEE